MPQDELAQISGINPNDVLADGEQREVGSTSSKAKYKIKRTFDHYYCSCPAWKNQAAPVNARTCKHLKSLLGDTYENARLTFKKSDAQTPERSSSNATTSAPARANPSFKRKRDNDSDVEQGNSMATKQFKTHTTDAPKRSATRAAQPNGTDELAGFNGIKPLVPMVHGEERDFGSTTSTREYKIKRTFDHYYCTCPAWKNQAGVPVNARTCKHLKSLLGDTYEDARLQFKTSGPTVGSMSDTVKKPTSSNQPTSTGKQVGKEVADIHMNAINKTSGPAVGSTSNTKKFTSNNQPISTGGGVVADVDMNDVFKKDGPAIGSTSNIKQLTSNTQPTPKGKRVVGIDTEDDIRKPTSNPQPLSGRRGVGKGVADVDMRDGIKEGGPALGSISNAKSSASNTQAMLEGRKVVNFNIYNINLKKEDDRKIQDQKQGTGKAEVVRPNLYEPERVVLSADQQTDDELAEIDGVKPKVYLKDGTETEVGSLTSESKYTAKRTRDHYYCTCPAWRNQGAPINARTCKHLKSLLGEAYEAARIRWKNPSGPQPTTTAPKRKGKARETAHQSEDDGDDAEARGTNGRPVPQLLLANKWDLNDGPDPTGWWVSEKLDGVRTYFDGKQMLSRLGNLFTPPSWFLEELPKDITLDGELFGGRGEFQSTVSIVRTVNSPHWKDITFQVFDAPSLGSQPFEARLAHLNQLFGPGGSHASDHVVLVAQEEVKSREHVMEKLKEVERLGGEGLMLREPKSLYEGKRSSTLLKVKTFYDAEAIVTGHAKGKGRNKGVTGALQCKMESGKTFSVGSGLSDKLRRNPPKVGSIIVYRFQELTRHGVPRFPTFVGISTDQDKPKDAEILVRKIG